jgi:F-type H+-transporting ATPase subunit gamma
MKKATSSAISLSPYAREADDLLNHLPNLKGIEHRYFDTPKNATKELLIIISSNKGLCGSYNTNIYRSLSRYIKQNSGVTFEAIAIGKQSEKIAKRLNIKIISSFIHFTEKSIYEETEVIPQIFMEKFESMEYKSVNIFYTKFLKAMTFETAVKKILPLESIGGESVGKNNSLYAVEPSVNFIIKRFLHTITHSALSESLASEHSARMLAMKTATDNASDMLKDLKIYYNRARQDAVTQEISEIAAGASAITG